jgi:predicted membrane chloride channel (bestrophin family)
MFPTSPLVKRLFPQMSVLIAWSIFTTWLFSKNCNLLQRFTLPLTPLSLLSTFVAALLTLRSNQGLDRLNQGRVAFGKVVLHTRDMAQLIAAFVYPHDPYLGLKCLRHVALVGWLLKHFLRGGPMDVDIVQTMLCPADADFCLRHRKPPVAIVARLRQVFHHMAEDNHKLSTAAEIALDHTASALNECITTTERIVASPIPPLYTAHTGLLLTFYLFCLPLALRGSGLLNAIGTVITTTVVGYAMLGLDEISHLLEQPFKLMPLYQLSKNSMRDVGDAIVLQPPALYETKAVIKKEVAGAKSQPDYW